MHRYKFSLAAVLFLSLASIAFAARVASEASPRFSVEAPNGWKAEAKTNGANQQILLQSSTRMLLILAVEVKNGDPKTAEVGALEWIRQSKFSSATIMQPAKEARFGSHVGHEMTVRDKDKDSEFLAWLASFAQGRIVYVCVGMSTPDDGNAAAADYRAVVATVQSGAVVASTGQPQVTKPRWRDRLKNYAKKFAHVLKKIPVFNPNNPH